MPVLSRWLLVVACFGLLMAQTARSGAQDSMPIQFMVVGGLANNAQYSRHEAPFWTEEVPRLTRGRVRAEITPSDSSGFRGPEMLSLMRTGIVPFGNMLLAVAAGEEPALNAIDLPVLNPDIASLRQTAALWRPRLETLLRERFGIQLLAIYTYPAQVVFCRQPFTSLADLTGRRIRVSSAGQGELMQVLSATPVVLPYAETVEAIRRGVVECAITGSLSGNTLGLHAVTAHISRQAISWGVSFFGANMAAWMALPPEIRTQLQEGLARLQQAIWDSAERGTEEGFACNAGRPECVNGTRGHMTIVEAGPNERLRWSRLLRDAVLPNWIRRCGVECAEEWNRTMAPTRGITARLE